MDWSMMLPELLHIIAQKHNFYYEDYISFAGVCKSWKSAASWASIKGHYTNGPPSRFPCLLLAEKVSSLQSKATTPMEDGENILNTTKEALPQTSGSLMLVDKIKEDNVRELFFLSNKTTRKVRVPETSGKLCMSSCGWLLTIGNDCAVKLIHPLSQEIINLPNIDTFPEFLEDSEWDYGIRKLVLLNPSSSSSSSSMVLVVLWGCSGKLGLCRPGDNNWIDVKSGSILDITYQNGLVYSFDVKNCIHAYDVYSKNPETTAVKIAQLPGYVYNEYVRMGYIVGGLEENSLLVVIREIEYHIVNDKLCGETYKTKSFKVFKYDLKSESEGEGWSVVKDLGRRALFVGFSSSFWMEEDSARVINGNCIYYTDDSAELYFKSKEGGGRDMGIYHMYNGTIESNYTGKSRSHLTPPIWVQPM